MRLCAHKHDLAAQCTSIPMWKHCYRIGQPFPLHSNLFDVHQSLKGPHLLVLSSSSKLGQLSHIYMRCNQVNEAAPTPSCVSTQAFPLPSAHLMGNLSYARTAWHMN